MFVKQYNKLYPNFDDTYVKKIEDGGILLHYWGDGSITASQHHNLPRNDRTFSITTLDHMGLSQSQQLSLAKARWQMAQIRRSKLGPTETGPWAALVPCKHLSNKPISDLVYTVLTWLTIQHGKPHTPQTRFVLLNAPCLAENRPMLAARPGRTEHASRALQSMRSTESNADIAGLDVHDITHPQ